MAKRSPKLSKAKASKRTLSKGKTSRAKSPHSKTVEAEILGPENNEDSEDSTSEELNDIEYSAEYSAEESMPLDSESREIESRDLEKVERAISPQDPLRRYMNEVKRYPLLTPEQELQLAQKMLDGDLNAAKALVSANLRLVVKIAFEYRTLYTNVLDLIQEGNIGLMKAVSKFDPTRGAKLSYYASWWIRSYILKYLLDNFRLVKVGTTQAQKKLFYHLMREKQRIEAQGLLAAPKLLADRLNVKEQEVVEMEQRLSSRGAELPLDAPVNAGDESKTSFIDLLGDESESIDNQLSRAQWIQLIREKLPAFEKTLGEKEAQVLQERILTDEPKTLQDIANTYGISRERVRQIEAKLIEKLRDHLKTDLEG